MADLGTMLYRAIAGRSPASEIDDFEDALTYVDEQAGTRRAAAAALGVSPRTFGRWLRGESRPRQGANFITDAVRGMYRRDLLSWRREERMRASGGNITFLAQYTYDAQTRAHWREVDIYKYLDDGWQERVIDAFLDGAEPEDLHHIFATHVNDGDFYARTFDLYAPSDETWDIREVRGWP